MSEYELLIYSGGGSRVMKPTIVNEVTLTSQFAGHPGELHFTCVKTEGLSFSEGDQIKFSVDGKLLFYGFVFEKSRDKLREKDGCFFERKEVDKHHIKVIAYDQLRYFRNKDTMVYDGKTASQLIRMLVSQYTMRAGDIVDTKYVIPRRREDNKTIFDIVQYALDLTTIEEKIVYVLYDDAGSLTLKNIEDMKLDIVIDGDTAENFDYKTSINDDTYNTVKLVRPSGNQQDSVLELAIEKDETNQKQWGVLQYHKSISDKNVNLQDLAKKTLSAKNRKTRKLKIKKAIGDTRVRAGSSLLASLNLGDIIVNNFFVVSRCTHMFGNGYHWMDLDLINGDEFV